MPQIVNSLILVFLALYMAFKAGTWGYFLVWVGVALLCGFCLVLDIAIWRNRRKP